MLLATLYRAEKAKQYLRSRVRPCNWTQGSCMDDLRDSAAFQFIYDPGDSWRIPQSTVQAVEMI